MVRSKKLKQPEHAVQRAILAGLGYRGIPAYRLNSGAHAIDDPVRGSRFIRYGFPGCPDIVALLNDGRTLWIEVKSATGRLSVDQKAFADLCRRHTVPYLIARSWDDVDQWIKTSVWPRAKPRLEAGGEFWQRGEASE